jgi:hypothetical protein
VRGDGQQGGWRAGHGQVIGHHVQPAWRVVLSQHMVDLVRERRGLDNDEHDDDQRA